jgi:acetoin utilization protein AcuB
VKTKVRDWMTPNPITIDAGESIVRALHLLKEKEVRRLPVLKDGKLVGLVTERMLLTFSPGKATPLDVWEVHYLLAQTPVTAAMNPHPHTVTPDTDLADCAQIIHDRKLNGITVVDETGTLVGILTTTNALEALIWFSRHVRDAGAAA